MHPIVPIETEMILEYLNLGEEFWNWERIFESRTFPEWCYVVKFHFYTNEMQLVSIKVKVWAIIL